MVPRNQKKYLCQTRKFEPAQTESLWHPSNHNFIKGLQPPAESIHSHYLEVHQPVSYLANKMRLEMYRLQHTNASIKESFISDSESKTIKIKKSRPLYNQPICCIIHLCFLWSMSSCFLPIQWMFKCKNVGAAKGSWEISNPKYIQSTNASMRNSNSLLDHRGCMNPSWVFHDMSFTWLTTSES